MAEVLDFYTRISKAYDYLLETGVIHNQTQFAKAIRKANSDVSNALNGNPKIATKGFCKKIYEAYSDVLNQEFLLEGIGDIAKIIGKPHIPFDASAGGVAIALGSVTLEECEKRPTDTSFAHYDFTIDARGDSMMPAIVSGDTLYCRWCGLNTVISRPNRFYIVDSPDGAVVKMIKVQETCILCESLNEKYEPFKIEISDDMRFAIVVGHTRKYE